jgi:disulfide bond formation protein DsbB
MNMLTPRLTSLICGLYCIGLLIFALYLQNIIGLDPCPLCIIQRIFFLIVGFFFLIGSLYTSPKPASKRWFYAVTLLFIMCGGAVAAWQVHLQHLPADTISSGCGADLGFMIQNLPFTAMLQSLLENTASCREVKWTFLTLSIPAWSTLSFLGLGIVAIWQMFREK